jgi:hypothetical protein
MSEIVQSVGRLGEDKPKKDESNKEQPAPKGDNAKKDTPKPKAEDKPKSEDGPSRSPINPLARANEALVSGLGGERFIVDAPPGPARLVPISFYPLSPSQSLAGANGIVQPGDDPTLLVSISRAGPLGIDSYFLARSNPYEVVTELFTYGTYRLLGIQCNLDDQAPTIRPAAIANPNRYGSIKGFGITVNSIQVYNGEELLLTSQTGVDSFDFNLRGDLSSVYLPETEPTTVAASRDPLYSPGLLLFHQQADINARSPGRVFVGLRDNPIVEGTAQIRMTVSAYAWMLGRTGSQTATQLPVSFTVIGDILEDRVFGDPLNPSAAARAGAQVRLKARVEGEECGVEKVQVSSTRWRRN